MKTFNKGAIRDEKGQVLILALVLLVVGGLILTPLLGLMSTGLLAGKVYEKKMDEYYAADAGVEDAIWKIMHSDNISYPYYYPEPLTVNNKSVDVVVYREDLDPTACGTEFTYRILSIAATDDGGGTAAIDSSTTIDAYISVSYLDFSDLLDNAIVSQDTITIKPGTEINGDIWLPDEDDLEEPPHWSHNGTVKDEDDVSLIWPTAGDLSGYYLSKVSDNDPGPSIDVKYTQTIGQCYREGSLAVDNTGNPATLVLEGTVYVTGDLEFQQSGSHEYTINLNGNTIFVEGEIEFPSHHVSISGSGCIIAVGNINFQPSIASEGDDFVLVMSITGKVNFQPSGDFTGCIAGDAHVQLQPGCTVNWISPEDKGLDFPGMGDGDESSPINELSIDSWEIK
jgi:cytoskeletal protein CcmA (bactofilin family)